MLTLAEQMANVKYLPLMHSDSTNVDPVSLLLQYTNSN